MNMLIDGSLISKSPQSSGEVSNSESSPPSILPIIHPILQTLHVANSSLGLLWPSASPYASANLSRGFLAAAGDTDRCPSTPQYARLSPRTLPALRSPG